MHTYLESMFSEQLVVVLEDLLLQFEEEYSEQDICREISTMSKSTRDCLLYLAEVSSTKEVIEKIKRCVSILEQKEIETFKENFDKGNGEVYLQKLNKVDKISLLQALDLNKKELNHIESLYKEVILNSIKKNQASDTRNSYDTYISYHKKRK